MRSRLDELIRIERELEPPPGTEERLWAALEAARLAPSSPASPALEAPAPVSALGKITPFKGLVGVALIAIAGAALLAEDVPREPEVPEAVQSVVEPEPEPRIVDARAASASSGGAPSWSSPPVVESASERPPLPAAPKQGKSEAANRPSQRGLSKKRARGGSGLRGPADVPAELDVDAFSAELRLIREIRGALRRRAELDVLRLADEHVRRFGVTGQFAQERFIYQIEALCSLDRVDEARRAAAELFVRWPGSPHRARIGKTCAG